MTRARMSRAWERTPPNPPLVRGGIAGFGLVLAVILALPQFVLGAERIEPVFLGTPERIEVFPDSIQLGSRRATMKPIVTAHYGDGWLQDVTAVASLSTSNDATARVDHGRVIPVADGATTLTIQVAGLESTIPVVVSGQGAEAPVSFQYGALAALTKQGCNSGACHGSPSGKGGFRLSLRAYDGKLDYETLAREMFGRRVNAAEPARSLILLKPTMQVAHGGGKKLDAHDPAYGLLHDWIREGCQAEPAEAPHCVGLEVYPARRMLDRPAQSQQLLALARFSDGSARDVTELATFSSSDESVAGVDAQGLVVGRRNGESAILVRYLEQAATSHCAFREDVDGYAWIEQPQQNFVDRHVDEKLRELRMQASPLCGDAEFVRRVYLDVIGVLPSVAETEAFLADTTPDKRARLIDALLERPEMADFWALKWADLLRVNPKKVGSAGVFKMQRWLVKAWRDNLPYDQFARQLLTAQGSTTQSPQAAFYRAAADMNDCVETVGQLFLGVRMQCAKCHNHPFDRWTQDNYYGLGAFFTRVGRKPGASADEMIVYASRSGESVQPRTGAVMSPWAPQTGPVDAPQTDRREAFVGWLTDPANPYFAKAEVNRIWGHLLGRGIVEPVDDFRDSNPPSIPDLLDALAADFQATGYDRRALIRAILNSRVYQQTAAPTAFNATDEKYFSHARVRRLSAEQLLDAVTQVTEVPEKFAGAPTGTRAAQMAGPVADHPFLKAFGQPARETACQCERSSDANLAQALQMINGPLINDKLRSDANRLRRLAKSGADDPRIVRELYLAAVCREPSAEEIATAQRHIASQPERLAALEDVCWALLNSKEFVFQH